MGKYMELNQDILFSLKRSYEASQRRAIGLFVLMLLFSQQSLPNSVACSSAFAYRLAFSGPSWFVALTLQVLSDTTRLW